MNRKKGKSNMFVATVIMAALAVLLLAVGWRRGGGEHVSGMKAALSIVREGPAVYFVRTGANV